MKKFLFTVVACLLVVAFTAPAMAKVKMGGIIFTDIMWDKRDDTMMRLNTGSSAQEANTILRMHDTLASRLYGTWTNEAGVGMHIQLGIGGTVEGTKYGNPTLGPEGVYLREGYGWYKMNPGFKLVAGMTTSCFAPLNSGQLMGFALIGDGRFLSPHAHAINAGYGNIYVERSAQIRGEWSFGPNNLKVALADYTNDAIFGKTPAFASAPNKTAIEETMIPRLDVGLKVVAGSWSIYPGFFYLTRSWDAVAAGNDDSFTSWGASVGLKGGLGPITITAELTQMVNGASAGMTGANTSAATGGSSAAAFIDANGCIQDAETLAGFIQFGFKAGPAKIQLSYGFAKTEQDNRGGIGVNRELNSTQYGISIPIPLAKIFIVRPEVYFIDEGDRKDTGQPDVELGTETLYGVNFQIYF
jgi:hypothetical protein